MEADGADLGGRHALVEVAADHAAPPDLLAALETTAAEEFALALDTHNRERQAIEKLILDEAIAMAAQQDNSPFLLVSADGWHPGVVGIVAGRISRKYNRPAIVLGNEGDLAKGSGRGITGSNLVEILGACAGCLENWGGHPMAVGVTLTKVRLGEFRAMFDEVIRSRSNRGN